MDSSGNAQEVEFTKLDIFTALTRTKFIKLHRSVLLCNRGARRRLAHSYAVVLGCVEYTAEAVQNAEVYASAATLARLAGIDEENLRRRLCDMAAVRSRQTGEPMLCKSLRSERGRRTPSYKIGTTWIKPRDWLRCPLWLLEARRLKWLAWPEVVTMAVFASSMTSEEEWQQMRATPRFIAERAGISKRAAAAAMQSLLEKELIAELATGMWVEGERCIWLVDGGLRGTALSDQLVTLGA